MRRRRKSQLTFTLATLIAFLCVLAWYAYPDINSLTRAAQSGDLRSVQLQLLLSVDPNQPQIYGFHDEGRGYTPLTAASFAGHRDVVRLLLRSGADVNLRDGSERFPGTTAITAAASVGTLDTCQLLLESGADPNIPSGTPRGWTALDWALQSDEQKAVQLLREHGGIEGARGRGG